MKNKTTIIKQQNFSGDNNKLKERRNKSFINKKKTSFNTKLKKKIFKYQQQLSITEYTFSLKYKYKCIVFSNQFYMKFMSKLILITCEHSRHYQEPFYLNTKQNFLYNFNFEMRIFLLLPNFWLTSITWLLIWNITPQHVGYYGSLQLPLLWTS